MVRSIVHCVVLLLFFFVGTVQVYFKSMTVSSQHTLLEASEVTIVTSLDGPLQSLCFFLSIHLSYIKIVYNFRPTTIDIRPTPSIVNILKLNGFSKNLSID